MEELTARQEEVLGCLAERLRCGRPPSEREMAEHFGLSQNAIHQLVGYLIKKGYVVKAGGHRGLRLSGAYEAVLAGQGSVGKGAAGEAWRGSSVGRRFLPVVGRVAAGEPILAEEHIEEYVDVGEMFGGGDDSFLVRVVGESMVDEGIMDGDYVVVRPQPTIESGQIGVVLLDDSVTVKRVFIQSRRIALKPANERAGYRTKYVRPDDSDVRIIGRVVGCMRRVS